MIIKILDIVTKEDEQGNIEETKKLYLPTMIYKKDIESVNPQVTNKGKLYKNVSIVSTYSGSNYTVVGNYKRINEILENDKLRLPIGYSNDRK